MPVGPAISERKPISLGWVWAVSCGLVFARRWPSLLRMILSKIMAPAAPQAKACDRAMGKVLLRGNAAEEMLAMPTNTATGAAAAAACPGFGAL